MLLATCPASAADASDGGTSATAPIIDTHAHPFRSVRRATLTPGHIIGAMDQFGVTLTVLLPPPFPAGHPGRYGPREFDYIVRSAPERFAFVAGGASLNGIIEHTAPENVTPEVIAAFRDEAEAIAKAGAAGYGEFAAEHFSSGRGNHPYESVRPDHPLFLLLADIAATHGMPIDLHMEAVTEDRATPPRFAERGPNPATLKENITAFERLLAHNPNARIIWAHAGWDNTGERSIVLMRRLLAKHANLYMSIKLDERAQKRNSPFDADGQVKPQWLALLREFPDRFMIGSDQFFTDDTDRLASARRFVNALPPDIVREVASENARRIYRLPVPPKGAAQR
ncbi:MAG: amidohydrolase family protein [Deltaproteobacteria bacterium]